MGEILEAMRGALGKDFPILFKLSAQDFVNRGLEPPEALQIAKRLQDDGIAAIQVSACCTISTKDKHCLKTEILEKKDEGYLLDFSQYHKGIGESSHNSSRRDSIFVDGRKRP